FLALLTLLVSLAPMLGLRRLGIAASSRQISARPTVAQRVAGTAQMAIAGTLGGAALAFAWHLGALLFAYPGYATRNIHVATFAMPPLNLAAQGNIAAAVTSAALERERIRDAVGALPGVQKLTMSGGAPGILGSVMGFGIADPNDPTKRLMLQALPVDEHYVDVLGL